jgi:hypothetical protein
MMENGTCLTCLKWGSWSRRFAYFRSRFVIGDGKDEQSRWYTLDNVISKSAWQAEAAAPQNAKKIYDSLDKNFWRLRISDSRRSAA